MRRSIPVSVFVCLAFAGCFDFGSPAPDAAIDASLPGDDAGAHEDGGGSCVEGPVDAATAGAIEIRIRSFTVDRPQLVVPAGGVVAWRNDDQMVHRMVAGAPASPIAIADGGFDSGELGTGQVYAHRFCRSRALTYFCATHPGGMKDYRLEIP